MTTDDTAGGLPLVSVVMATRDRPRLLAVALECYRRQTYPHRELVVVDDGDQVPVDATAVRAVGGRLIRVVPGTALGVKLNLGVEVTRGSLCQKIDDDDWYAPTFLWTMTGAVLESWRIVCRPIVAYLSPFLFFDLPRWEVRRTEEARTSGGTFLFQRENWRERPFHPVNVDEDSELLRDHFGLGCTGLPVRGIDRYLAVWRGDGTGPERGHTWSVYQDGNRVEDVVRTLNLYGLGDPESIVPDWALRVYRELHRELASQPLA